MKRLNVFLLVIVFVFQSVTFSYAQEKFEDTNAGKAAKEALEAMTNLLNDWTEISNLPLEEKIKVVAANAQKRIWDKMKDQQWGVTKNAISEYAKAKMRQGLFQEATARMMHQCVVEGKSVAAVWSAVDADITSKVDTGMKAFGHALDAAEISYSAYKKWNEGKTSEALTDMGKAIADKVMEYMIPGWGYYRLAQSLVEALGNWVMKYAFDTALEGKINQILPVSPRTNPEKFATWILATDVAAYVNREWDEQIGYGGWYAKYDGKDDTKDESGSEMKKKIIETLEKLKSEAAEKKRVEDELRAKYEEQDRAVRDAEQAIRESTKELMQQIENTLRPLTEYQERMHGLKRQDAQEAVETVTEYYEEVEESVPDASAYQPINRAAIIDMLKNVYDQVQETFSDGYDIDTMMAYQKQADDLKAEEIAKIKPQLEQAEKEIVTALAAQLKAVKPLSDQITSIMEAHGWRYLPDEVRKQVDALSEQKKAVWDSFQGAVVAAQNKKTSIRNLSVQDKGLLAAEEKLLIAEAAVRFDLMIKQLKIDLEKIQKEIDSAAQVFSQKISAFEAAKEQLHYGDLFESIENDWFIASGFPPVSASSPEEVQSVAKAVRAEIEKWKADAQKATGIEAMRAAAYAEYHAAYGSAKNRFESIVNKNCRDMGDDDSDYVQSWTAKVYNVVPDFNVESGAFQVQLPYISFNAYQKRNVAGRYAKKIKALEEHLRGIEHFEPAANLGVYFWKLLGETDLRLYEKSALSRINIEALCERKGEEYGFSVDPDDSDGAEFIRAMKAAWEQDQDKVLALKRIRDEYLKVAGGFTFKYSDPRQDTLLDQYSAIPDLIDEYDAILAGVKEKRAQLFASLASNLTQYQKLFEEYTTKIVDYRERIPKLEALGERVRNQQKLFLDRGIKNLPALDKELIDALGVFSASLDTYMKKLQDDINQGIYAASNARVPDQRMPSYSLANVTLNAIPAHLLLTEQVFTQSDLDDGAFRVRGELSTVDGVTAMKISNGVGDEQKLNISPSFEYVCKARTGDRYRFELQIATALGRTMTFELFPGTREIRFEDINFEERVVHSISGLADAYETANVASFTDFISRQYAGSQSALEEGVRFDFTHFTNIKLRIGIRRIEKRKELFVAETEWQRMQSLKSTASPVEKSGKTTLMFIFEDGKMRIKNMRGDLIFASLSPEIAQMQGVSQREVERIRKEHEALTSGSLPGVIDPPHGGGDPRLDPDPPARPADTIESGSFKLTQYSAHPMSPGTLFAESFDFARRQVVNDYDINVSGDFRRREGWIEAGAGAGVLEISGAGIDSVTEVPSGGYQSAVGTRLGGVYAIERADGTYAVVEFQSANGDSPDLYEGRAVTSQFRYKYQKNGTRIFQ
jgi:hypothetical protein